MIRNGMEHEGCDEYREISRRRLMQRAIAVTAAAAVSPSWMPKVAFAANENSSRDVLVSIFMRGGYDGLTLCAPFGDPGYYQNRPALSIAPPDAPSGPKLVDLDGFFGLPPSMALLKEAFVDRGLAVVHAAGLKEDTRSHFDAQRLMESGLSETTTGTSGWVGRHLASSSPANPSSSLRGLSLSIGLPTSMYGASKVVPVSDPTMVAVGGLAETELARRYWLGLVYDDSAALSEPAEASLKTLQVLRQIDFLHYVPATSIAYPVHDFGKAMKAAAALIKADVGVETIAMEMGGWDTHQKQGVTEGSMANLMQVFSTALAAFYEDVFVATTRKVLVVVMSEFGRTVAENASLGTDHGHGNAMFVLGRKIEGGKVITDWPGLSEGQLYQDRDLKITADYRDVLSEIVAKRLGNSNLSFVFPGYTPRFLNILG